MTPIDAALSRSRTVIALLVLILASGLSAYVNIPKEARPDIAIPNVYVSMSLKGVSPEDADRFVPVEILGDSGAGVWVSGLADGDRLITVGHEFVESGQRVRPVPETEDTAS